MCVGRFQSLLVFSPALSTLISADHLAVQGTCFEKSATRNWLVPIHQDLSIPVASRVDEPGLHGWSEKEGALFVQAPARLLAQLVAVRVHLDLYFLFGPPVLTHGLAWQHAV